MRFLSVFIGLFLTLFVTSAFAGTNAGEYKAEFQFNHSSGFQNNALGSKVIRDTVRDLKLQYNFAKMAGAIGTLNMVYPQDPGFPGGAASGALPKNAIVVGCYIDVLTAPVSAGAATLAFGTGQTNVDLLAATAKTSFVAGTIVACIPVGTAATAIKLTADRVPTVTIGAAALTAGIINVHMQYVLSDQ